jgi:hypothetical protein
VTLHQIAKRSSDSKPERHPTFALGESGMMTLHAFVVQLLLILGRATILVEIDGRR